MILPAMIASCFVVLALQISGNLGQNADDKDAEVNRIIACNEDVLEKAKSGIHATDLETGLAKCSQLVDQYLDSLEASVSGQSIYDLISSMSPSDHTIVVSSVFDNDFVVVGNKIGNFLTMVQDLVRKISGEKDPEIRNVYLATLKFIIDSIVRSVQTAERLYPYYLTTGDETNSNIKRSWEVKGSISTGSGGTKGSVSASKSWGRRSVVSLDRNRRQWRVALAEDGVPMVDGMLVPLLATHLVDTVTSQSPHPLRGCKLFL
ncbi:unnamed protein product [Lymnaea stagnalis]|uniref:Uncharacterized protein n=1 Tax=Lymnaea stagnalis TaxID=6523 RepID=A0AAV2HWA0_LYMST